MGILGGRGPGGPSGRGDLARLEMQSRGQHPQPEGLGRLGDLKAVLNVSYRRHGRPGQDPPLSPLGTLRCWVSTRES